MCSNKGVKRFRWVFISSFCLSLLPSCGTLKVKNVEDIKKNEEFDQAVHIEEVSAPRASEVPTAPIPAPPVLPSPPPAVTPAKVKKPKKAKLPKSAEDIRRPPELEDSVGFVGGYKNRRPQKDPFRVGEKIVHQVRWATFNAGTLTFEVLPFANVNSRLNYQFKMSIRTSPIFSTFHRIDDFVTTLVDYETLVPSVFKLSVDESNQFREAQAFFDPIQLKARFWEKKVTKQDGETSRKLEWDILAYSQNVYSAAFYIRNFVYQDGKTYPFRVANEGENLVFKAKVLRRETLNTAVGEFPVVVIQPEIELQGTYKPMGENLMFLSDDDRKYILRIESKIQIGTLVSEVSELNPGR